MPRTVNITIPNREITKFRRWAKEHYPREIMSSMYGVCIDGTFCVDHISVPVVGSRTDVSYDDPENDEVWEDIDEFAESQGLKFIGSIHTHTSCDFDAAPSAHDIEAISKSDEKVYGICSVWKFNEKFRTRIRFYAASPILKVTRT